MSEPLCETCNKADGYCECVPCRSCGWNEDLYEIYNGLCRGCEDEQMVRSIR